MVNHIENEKYLVGVFEDEDVLMKAVKKLKGSGVHIHEVFSPYPIHGLDIALGYKKSRLPKAAFLFGVTGTTLALTMMTYMLTLDWPVIVGGKDHWPLPNLIPITFELTVLLSALGMVGTFLLSNDLYPGKSPKMFDIRSTDDKFVMAVELGSNSSVSPESLIILLKDNGATEVNEKQFS